MDGTSKMKGSININISTKEGFIKVGVVLTREDSTKEDTIMVGDDMTNNRI